MLVMCMGVLNVSAKQKVFIKEARVENQINEDGVVLSAPIFTWEFYCIKKVKKLRQKAYQILVGSTPENLQAVYGDVWDTRRVKTDLQQAYYAGPALKPGKRYYWRVAVTTNKGVALSKTSSFVMGE